MTTKTTTPANASKQGSLSKPTPESGKPFSLPEYFKGVRAEWGKITWPSKMQVVSQTIVVLIMVAVMTLGLWLTDRVLYDGLVCHIIPDGQERCYQQKQ
ncbi:MAG: preprotein translocase subunit SecE [Vampirovibrionales bacterium]|nr:preprotein translocase subunit SecE [Vampirovibrionales bacterium]